MIISTRFADISFSVLALAGAYLIFKEPSSAALAIDSWNPWLELGCAFILTIIMASYAVWGAKLDRRCAEDYVFQLVTNAALIAVITSIMSHAIWDMSFLNERGLPKPTSGDMLGVMILSWAMGYGFYRIKGFNA